MDKVESNLLDLVADLHEIPLGAYNIRTNGISNCNSTADIEIVAKTDKSGIDIFVQPNTKNQSIHIPVLVTEGGLKELVYNDFYIGENADIVIVAGCGIHNNTELDSEHNGIHSFHLAENSKVKYIEKHIGIGDNIGKKSFNPKTKIEMKKGSLFEMETIQLSGVSNSVRNTIAKVYDNAQLIIKEKILTTDNQSAKTNFKVNLKGKNSKLNLISRSVAKDCSYQNFFSEVVGENECFAHVECDGILVEKGRIDSTPKIICKSVNASLVHEAAIGKIAGEQILKLMTLGLNEKQAEELIIKGFLK